MGTETKIQWCDHTFNGWIGCKKVSPGCAMCYAEIDTPARTSRSQGLELWGPPPAKRRLTSEALWKQPLRWNRQAGEEGRQHRVFAFSQADVFEDYVGQMVDHKGQPLWLDGIYGLGFPRVDRTSRNPYTMDHARQRLFKLIEETPNLIWQLLTKRPENMGQMAPDRWEQCGWPANVWAMTSVENQEMADKRIPELLRVPAQIRGLSVEPLLGPVDLDDYLHVWLGHGPRPFIGKPIHWVIIGGESGPHARDCDWWWARRIIRQCKQAGVSCFMKQLGSNSYLSYGVNNIQRTPRAQLKDAKGGNPAEWPEDLRVREFPKE